jgi:hypothetical protein
VLDTLLKNMQQHIRGVLRQIKLTSIETAYFGLLTIADESLKLIQVKVAHGHVKNTTASLC